MKKLLILNLFFLNCFAANKGEQELFDAVAQSKLTLQDSLSKIKNLINSGVNINARDQAGSTPLHEAVLVDSPDVVSLLLELGAQDEAVNNARQSPLDLALEVKSPKIINKLLEVQEDRILNAIQEMRYED